MALASTGMDDFGAGIYRGRKAPADSVYDANNLLVNDEGILYRRGGSEYHSASNASITPRWLNSLYMPAPAANRVLIANATDAQVLDGALAPSSLGAANPAWAGLSHWSRPAVVGEVAFFAIGPYLGAPGLPNAFFYYGGSLKTAEYATGTASTTAGSPIVTGAGTSWAANVDPGMIAAITSYLPFGAAVKSVESNTQITLTKPASVTGAGLSYQLKPSALGSWTADEMPALASRGYVANGGGGIGRLLYCIGNRVYLINRDDPTIDTYHEVGSTPIVGAQGRGDHAMFFTMDGIWRISNLSLDPVDSYGNIQHVVEHINTDAILWDDFGVAGFAGALILPCVDDVFLANDAGALTPITGRIRPLYREYVQAGYQLGQASVHRGHYQLPVMNGTTLVDVLVCRLDRDAAWTRWSGGAAGTGYATQIEESTRSPKLLGLAGQRVTDLSGCFAPQASNSADADGTVHTAEVITRDFPIGQQPGFVQRARVRYELTDGGTPDPAVAIAFSSDQDAGTFTTLTERGEQNGGTGWGTSDGSLYQWALVAKRRERIRFRLRVTGACASFALRGIELLTRPQGKQ